MAVAYQSENDIPKTKKILEEIFTIDPFHVGAHKLISSIFKYSKNDNNSLEHLKKMEELDKNINVIDYEKEVDISFALGKAHEDLKDYEKAFKYLATANLLKYEKFG